MAKWNVTIKVPSVNMTCLMVMEGDSSSDALTHAVASMAAIMREAQTIADIKFVSVVLA